MPKVIIQVLQDTHSDPHHENLWGKKIGMGLGDFIRGTVRLNQVCKRLNCRLIVDTSLHDLSSFTQSTDHEYKHLITDTVPFININKLDEYLSQQSDNVLVLSTNDFCDESITQEDKNLIKSVLQYKSDYKHRHEDFLNKDYKVVHFRLDDESFRTKELSFNDEIKNALYKLLDKDTIFLSNNNKLREFVRFENLAHVFDFEATHFGEAKKSLEDTLFEFKILNKAQSIITYSVYDWISGFAYWSHKIYDVPLSSIISLDPLTVSIPNGIFG